MTADRVRWCQTRTEAHFNPSGRLRSKGRQSSGLDGPKGPSRAPCGVRGGANRAFPRQCASDGDSLTEPRPETWALTLYIRGAGQGRFHAGKNNDRDRERRCAG